MYMDLYFMNYMLVFIDYSSNDIYFTSKLCNKTRYDEMYAKTSLFCLFVGKQWESRILELVFWFGFR